MFVYIGAQGRGFAKNSACDIVSRIVSDVQACFCELA
jgi:hypothetical protein